MIRILHVFGGLNRGGAETMIMNLYRSIDKTKLQFDFIVHTSRKQAYEDEIIALGGRIYVFPRFNGLNFLFMKKYWTSFLNAHREYRVLHSHVRSYASLFIPIAKKRGLKTIVHSHSTSNGKGVVSIAKRLMQYPLRKQADFFIGCSKEAGEWLFGKKTLQSDRYYMLPNAIDVEAYRFKPEIREKYRSILGLKDERTFIHVGRFHPAKNHAFLLDLFEEIHKTDNNTKLILVGDGELRPKIEKRIHELHLASSVILTGSRNDVPNLLMVADCFLFPSLWEGLPVTVIEAQAAGLPCLISDRVTNDVRVSELVHPLSIKNGVDEWIKTIYELDYMRQDVSKQIVNAGFDVNTTAVWLEDFYQGL